jgi:hypothetical protein
MSKNHPAVGDSVQILYPFKCNGRVVEVPAGKTNLSISDPHHPTRGVWINNGKYIAHYPWTSFSIENVNALANPPPEEKIIPTKNHHQNNSTEKPKEINLECGELNKFLLMKF